MLGAKFRLGLFENPYVDPERAIAEIGRPEHKQAALEVARAGMTLLKNEGNILPLLKDAKSIAVIGPNADNMYNQLGDYTAPQRREDVVTILDGIRQKVSSTTKVRYAQGCRIKNPSKEGFAEAIEAARQSDVAVVVVGGSSGARFRNEICRHRRRHPDRRRAARH